MNSKVWLPESSLADCEPVQQPTAAAEKEKRRRTKITKRTTPTVEFPTENPSRRQRKQTYSTIESGSYSRKSLHLALNDVSTGGCPTKTELCGWETERNKSFLHSPSVVRRCTAEPVTGQRSALQSRSGGRACGKSRRNSVYEFRHLSDPSAYLQDYCARYCYSALVLSRENGGCLDPIVPERDEKTNSEKDTKCEQSNNSSSSQTKEEASYAQCLVKSRGSERREQQQEYLQQLASRLGVKESLQEGQLRYRPRPTPPSFTRKTRVVHDILVSTQDDRSPSQMQESDSQTPNAEQQQITELGSKQEHSASERPHTTSAAPDSLQLPTIPPPPPRSAERNKKILSTSSVTKYLRISSRPHHSLGLGEEESAADASSHGSLAVPSTTETIPEVEENGAGETTVNYGIQKEKGRGDQQYFLLDVSWRERVLAEKAQALGLVSRDWTQARLVNRTIGEWQTTGGGNSRPHTRSDTRAHSRMRGEKDSLPARRPCTRADTRNRRQEESQNTSYQTSRTHTNYRLTQLVRSSDERATIKPVTCGNEKLEKARAVYEASGSVQWKRSLSQQQSRQRNERRPVTRCGEVRTCEMEREKKRPATRLGKKVQRKFENDGSQYWNEVPRIGHYIISQSHTGTKTLQKQDSYSRAAEPTEIRPPPQRVRLSSSHRMLRHAAHETRNISIELSGHVYRHRNRYSYSYK